MNAPRGDLRDAPALLPAGECPRGWVQSQGWLRQFLQPWSPHCCEASLGLESAATDKSIPLAFRHRFPLKASRRRVARDGQSGALLLPQPCHAPQPGGAPRCSAWAAWVTRPRGQPAPTESTALAFQSLGLPLGEAENKQTRQRRAGLLTCCLLVLITQECLVCGVLLFFLRLTPPSLSLPPKPREADCWCCRRGHGAVRHPGEHPRSPCPRSLHGSGVGTGRELAPASKTRCGWGPCTGLSGGRLRGDPGWKRAVMLRPAGWGRCLWSEQRVPRSQTHPVRQPELRVVPRELRAPERSLGRASLTGIISEIFPLARLLPASVNNAVDSGKHVFLGRLLFLEEVSWRCFGGRMALVPPGERRWQPPLSRWESCRGVEAEGSCEARRVLGCSGSPAAPGGFGEQRPAAAVEEERLERRELVPRQPHARANNNLWKRFPTRFSPGRPN